MAEEQATVNILVVVAAAAVSAKAFSVSRLELCSRSQLAREDRVDGLLAQLLKMEAQPVLAVCFSPLEEAHHKMLDLTGLRLADLEAPVQPRSTSQEHKVQEERQVAVLAPRLRQAKLILPVVRVVHRVEMVEVAEAVGAANITTLALRILDRMERPQEVEAEVEAPVGLHRAGMEVTAWLLFTGNLDCMRDLTSAPLRHFGDHELSKRQLSV